MKYLGTLVLYSYRLRLQNRQPNSGTKSMYSSWIALPKPLVTDKSVASITDQREYSATRQAYTVCSVWGHLVSTVCPLLLMLIALQVWEYLNHPNRDYHGVFVNYDKVDSAPTRSISYDHSSM